jgi:hypothetical protein
MDNEFQTRASCGPVRKAIISRNFHNVSTCKSENGDFAGAKALSARCSNTLESFPIE